MYVSPSFYIIYCSLPLWQEGGWGAYTGAEDGGASSEDVILTTSLFSVSVGQELTGRLWSERMYFGAGLNASFTVCNALYTLLVNVVWMREWAPQLSWLDVAWSYDDSKDWARPVWKTWWMGVVSSSLFIHACLTKGA